MSDLDQVSGSDERASRQEPLTMELSPIDLPGLEVLRSCPVCSAEVPVDDVFCQTCGLQLTNDRQHFSEQPGRWLAAVTDRGLRHPRNEDASATDADEPAGFGILVVCDGVSSARDTDLASLVAARAARDELRPLADRHAPDTDAPDTDADRLTAALLRAVGAANAEICRQTEPDTNASATLAVAVVDRDLIGWASVGDSRVYWLPDAVADGAPAAEGDEPQLLSHDDSVAELRIELGVPRQQAESGPQAHAITNWIGHRAPAEQAETGVLRPGRPGWLVVCSDGLWNYASEAAELRRVIDELSPGLRPGALALADALVRWACEQGGTDNVTVALVRIGTVPAGPPSANS